MSTMNEFLDSGSPQSSAESLCKKYLLFLLVYDIMHFFYSVDKATSNQGDGGLQALLGASMLLLNLSFFLVVIYLNYKSKVWGFWFRLLPSFIVIVFTVAILKFLFGSVMFTLWVLAAIFINRKRFRLFLLYKSASFYAVFCYALILAATILTFLLVRTGTISASSPWPAVIGLTQGLVLLIAIGRFMLQEVSKGKSFYEIMRILALIPTCFIYFLISPLTIIPIKFFSGKSLFGEVDSDCIAMPRPANEE